MINTTAMAMSQPLAFSTILAVPAKPAGGFPSVIAKPLQRMRSLTEYVDGLEDGVSEPADLCAT
jgi:hypothetical protein